MFPYQIPLTKGASLPATTPKKSLDDLQVLGIYRSPLDK